LIFCYILDDEKSIPWKQWNLVKKFNEKFIGAVNIPNARDTYALFYDRTAEMIHSETFTLKLEKDIKKLKEAGKPMGFGYKGLVNTGHEDEDGKINYGISNQLRLSSIPKKRKPLL
jgi:hypothetical protein